MSIRPAKPASPAGELASAKPGKPSDERRVDLRLLARQGTELQGQLPQASCLRLAQSVESSGQGADVAWSARGELRAVNGGEPQVWLHLAAQTRVRLVCQRCLKGLDEALTVGRSFLFVPDEDEAQRLDEEIDDDVLVLPRWFDLLELLEDELILALPIVPRHEICPEPLPLPADDLASGDDLEESAHPFAALAALKKPQRPN